MQQGTRQVQTLLHTAGIGFNFLIPAIQQVHQFQQLGDAFARKRGLHGVKFGEVAQVLHRGQPAVQPARAAKGETDALAHLHGIAQNIQPEDRDCAARGQQQRGKHLHGRSFSRAVGAKQAEELSFTDLEGHFLHSFGHAGGSLPESLPGLEGLFQLVGGDGFLIRHGGCPIHIRKDERPGWEWWRRLRSSVRSALYKSLRVDE